jgi:hypothetical protein
MKQTVLNVNELLAILLPQKERTSESLVEKIKDRYLKREANTASARNKVCKRLKSIVT